MNRLHPTHKTQSPKCSPLSHFASIRSLQVSHFPMPALACLLPHGQSSLQTSSLHPASPPPLHHNRTLLPSPASHRIAPSLTFPSISPSQASLAPARQGKKYKCPEACQSLETRAAPPWALAQTSRAGMTRQPPGLASSARHPPSSECSSFVPSSRQYCAVANPCSTEKLLPDAVRQLLISVASKILCSRHRRMSSYRSHTVVCSRAGPSVAYCSDPASSWLTAYASCHPLLIRVVAKASMTSSEQHQDRDCDTLH